MISPNTPAEWEEYVSQLDDDTLWKEAIYANSLHFVQALQDEGVEAKDITATLVAFVKELRDRGYEPPGRTQNSYLDLRVLA